MAEPVRSLKDALALVSRSPERVWPDGVVHHGARVALLLALALVVQLLFPAAPIPDLPALERGMVAEEDIIAQADFPIYKTEAELERDRQDQAASVAPIFVYDSTAVDTVIARIDRFLGLVDSVVDLDADSLVIRDEVRAILNAYGQPRPTPEAIDLLLDERRRRALERSLKSAVRDELPQGVAASGDLEDAAAPQIRIRRPGNERIVPTDSVRIGADFLNRAARFHLDASRQPEMAEFQRLLLIRFFEPSYRFDRAATEAERERARQAVPLVKGRVLRGERIVTAHELVGEEEMERFRAYQQHLARTGQLDGGAVGLRAVGAFLFNLTVLFLFGLLLFFFRREVYADMRQVSVLGFLVLAVVGGAAIIAGTAAPSVLIPIAFASLVAAALWDGRLALNLSLILAVLLAGQAPFLGVSVLTTLVVAGAAASLSVRVVRRRAQTWGFIVIILGAYLLSSVILGMLRSWTVDEVFWTTAWGALNAVGSGFAAMGFLPLFEAWTRITTDQTLLELADANRPLLRRLSREAPGTYAHSINVANLAEAAASAIDANALLTRVGVYYHDVGKIAKPQYFIENQPGNRNPHDKLKPATSAVVVRGHVLEGLRLAEQAKLPASVTAFIAEHHGTQPISFFFDKAQELDPDAELDEAEFRYPGPRPRSKETAVAMLADSVESAARALPDPTPDRIRELVDRIVKVKMDLRQLDDTPLTLAELGAIKDQFVSVLTGMYHQRIDYPAPREDESPTPETAPVGGTP